MESVAQAKIIIRLHRNFNAIFQLSQRKLRELNIHKGIVWEIITWKEEMYSALRHHNIKIFKQLQTSHTPFHRPLLDHFFFRDHSKKVLYFMTNPNHKLSKGIFPHSEEILELLRPSPYDPSFTRNITTHGNLSVRFVNY